MFKDSYEPYIGCDVIQIEELNNIPECFVDLL